MQQGLTAAPLSWQKLQQYGYDQAQLGLGPWHWHHRQPPQCVRQLAARHLLTTFFNWQQLLQAQPEPFYLAVWLAGPHFAHESGVAAGIGERRARYGGVFGASDPAGPPLPAEYRQLPGATTLTWATHPWYVGLNEFDYSEGWPAWALSKPHYVQQFDAAGTFLMVQTGWVWVGQAPAT